MHRTDRGGESAWPWASAASLQTALLKPVILAELEGPAPIAPGAGQPLPTEPHPWEVIWSLYTSDL